MAKETKNAAVASVSLEGYVPSLQKKYKEEIVAKLMKDFGFKSVMQVPVLEKITINQGMGQATADKKLIEVAQQELTMITGQKAMLTYSRKDISNFKLRKVCQLVLKLLCVVQECMSSLRDLLQYLYLVSVISKVSTRNWMAEETIL
jgi:large subunit ribosomal protein L5